MTEKLRAKGPIYPIVRDLAFLWVSLALSFEAAAQETGTVVRDKFSVLYSAPKQEAACSDLEYYLDQPTVFSWEDLAGSLLSTSQSLIWQRYEGGEWRNPRIIGDLGDHKVLERLTVDLDHDGNAETIVRQWGQYKSQQHNRLSLFDRTNLVDPTKSEPLLTPKLLQSLLDRTGKGLKADSDFYFFDVIEATNRPHIIALATIWPGAERDDRIALVLLFAKNLEPKLACVLRTNVLGVH